MLSSETIKYLLEKGIPVLAVIITWFLASATQSQKNTREEKIKLKRLLYNLLELHSCLSREKNFHEKINSTMDLFMQEAQKQIQASESDFEEIKRMMIIALRQQVLMQKQLPDFEAATEAIIKDLSEVNPIFAFELAGKFQISEKLNVVNAYLSHFDVSSSDPEAKNLLLTEVLRPQYIGEVIVELEEYICFISKKLNRKTHRRAISAIENTTKIDFSDLPKVVEDYFAKALPLFRPDTVASNNE